MAIALVYNKNRGGDCFSILNDAIWSLNHRGQDSNALGVSNGRSLTYTRGEGSRSITSSGDILSGPFGISQNSSSPITRLSEAYSRSLRKFSVAFDGYLLDGDNLRQQYGGRNDGDVAARFIADANNVENGIENFANATEGRGCWNIHILTEGGGMYAARCPLGIKPMVVGTNDSSYIISKESRTFLKTGAVILRDINAGEIVELTPSGVETIKQLSSNLHLCSFEFPYYASPDSMIEGLYAGEIREGFGFVLGENDKKTGLEADAVSEIPASGIFHAAGYARGFGCDHYTALYKDQYAERSYDKATQTLRDIVAGKKISPLIWRIRGKTIVIVDDSLRRGSQTAGKQGPIRTIQQYNPKGLHVRFGSTRNDKYCRMQPPQEGTYRDDLLAANLFPTDEKLATHFGVSTVSFISLDDFVRVLTISDKLKRENLCLGCYQGGDFNFLKNVTQP
ncbi:MAG: hypothetical protein ABIA21_03345 [Candidatus Aenigmatarchaeota archaeon]